MITREKYCAVCGCLFSLPKIRDPVNPDPDEDPLLVYSDPYDSRLLREEMTEWLTNFQVVGHWAEISPSLVNTSSAPHFFHSAGAEWDYGQGVGEPAIPTTAGKMAKIAVYEPIDDVDGMVFPIHDACLNLLHRLCHVRQIEHPASGSKTPKTLDDFCDALHSRREENSNRPYELWDQDHYYANSGGIEWPHNYYGARQFWADEWNTEPGWEFLCADPSPLKIPDLTSYIISELSESPTTVSIETSSQNTAVERLGWLFPEEADAIKSEVLKSGDWEKGVEGLLSKASLISADEGGVDDENKKLKSAPLGLKNRWRIWKILQGI